MPRISPRNWRFAGPPSPQRLNLFLGLGVWVWSGVSPLGLVPPSLATRYLRLAFSRIATDARLFYLYGDEEIEKLLRRTQRLPSCKRLRARTFTTLFGLLVATGMRVNEALCLDRPDVDLDHGTLIIRRTSFGKSRYVPVYPSTVEALKQYARARDRLFPATLTSSFFVSEHGQSPIRLIG